MSAEEREKKSTLLLEAIGDLPEDMLAKAEPERWKKKRASHSGRRIVKIGAGMMGAVAAAFVCVLVGKWSMGNHADMSMSEPEQNVAMDESATEQKFTGNEPEQDMSAKEEEADISLGDSEPEQDVPASDAQKDILTSDSKQKQDGTDSNGTNRKVTEKKDTEKKDREKSMLEATVDEMVPTSGENPVEVSLIKVYEKDSSPQKTITETSSLRKMAEVLATAEETWTKENHAKGDQMADIRLVIVGEQGEREYYYRKETRELIWDGGISKLSKKDGKWLKELIQ